jgi:hypothetical protein
VVLVWQTPLIAEQNQYTKEQNTKLQLQIDQQADQDTNRRRTEIIAVLYDTERGSQGPLVARANPRTRAEAVSKFVRLERLRIQKLKLRGPPFQTELGLTQARLDGLNLDGTDLHGLSLVGTFLENTSSIGVNLQGADLRAALLESTGFANAPRQGAKLDGANPLQVSFSREDLRGTSMRTVGVDRCEFIGADLRGADLQELRAGRRPVFGGPTWPARRGWSKRLASTCWTRGRSRSHPMTSGRRSCVQSLRRSSSWKGGSFTNGSNP